MTGTTKHAGGRPRLGGCGTCTYNFDPGTGCYDRQGTGGCTSPCRCAPTVCGLGSTIIQNLRPATVESGAPVTLNCGAASSDEEWLIGALIQLAQEESSSTRPWKAIAIGLGILSAGLMVGLAVALLTR